MNKNRKIIYDKYNGHCAYCGCDLPKIWHIDHLLPLERNPFTGVQKYPERNKIDNLMPSCPSCNNYKHSYSLQEFRRLISDLKTQLERFNQYKIAKRYGLVTENDIEVKFYFEIF